MFRFESKLKTLPRSSSTCSSQVVDKFLFSDVVKSTIDDTSEWFSEFIPPVAKDFVDNCHWKWTSEGRSCPCSAIISSITWRHSGPQILLMERGIFKMRLDCSNLLSKGNLEIFLRSYFFINAFALWSLSMWSASNFKIYNLSLRGL